jgi:hypothetical protein
MEPMQREDALNPESDVRHQIGLNKPARHSDDPRTPDSGLSPTMATCLMSA